VEENRRKLSAPRWRVGLRAHAWLALHPPVYRAVSDFFIRVLNVLGRRRGGFSRLPFANGWSNQRDFPAPQRGTFMQLYKKAQRNPRDEQ
jgi:L-lactate dehydrogenase complex protein LldF